MEKNKIINDKFNGSPGEYSTLFNMCVRIIGHKNTQCLQKSDTYKRIAFYINNAANKEENNIRHPEYKVRPWYGMKEEAKELLSYQDKEWVSAYNSEWLKNKLNLIL